MLDKRCLALVVMLLWGGLASIHSAPVKAAQTENPAPEASARENGQPLTRREVSAMVREHYRGRILSIRLEDGIWRVRMDDEGRVFNVFVNPRTGEITGPDD